QGEGQTGGYRVLIEVLAVVDIGLETVGPGFGLPPDMISKLATVEDGAARPTVTGLPILIHIDVMRHATDVLVGFCLFYVFTFLSQSDMAGESHGHAQRGQLPDCFHRLSPSGVNGLQCNHWNNCGL